MQIQPLHCMEYATNKRKIKENKRKTNEKQRKAKGNPKE